MYIAQCVDCGGSHELGVDPETGLIVKLEPCVCLPRCRVTTCPNLATWEGWYRRSSTEAEQIMVCGEHRHILLGEKS